METWLIAVGTDKLQQETSLKKKPFNPVSWPTSQDQKAITLHWTRMADQILKFMIGHLGLGSNVQLGLVDFWLI